MMIAIAKKRVRPLRQGRSNQTRKVMVRLSEKQHAELKRRAAVTEVSMNEYIVFRLFPEDDELYENHWQQSEGEVVGEQATSSA